MGALTVAIDRNASRKDVGYVVANVTFSASYGAGGDTYTDKQFEMLRIDAIMDAGTTGSATTGYVLTPDLSGRKIRLIGGAAASAPLAESATAGQTGTVARVIVFGIPAV